MPINWKPVNFRTQFFGRLQAHSNKVWADGGRRIRAYDSNTLRLAWDLVHVLNSSGNFPAFDDLIIRLKSKGELACWRWEIRWTFAFTFVDTIAKDTSYVLILAAVSGLESSV